MALQALSSFHVKRTMIETEAYLLDTGLEAIEQAMHRAVSSDVTVLREASEHILSAGGKRIRPRLLMLAYLACGGTDVDYAAPPAAAVELMHTASVVHDDINDHGVVRRGQASVNSKFGRTFALLTGDFLFTAVYQMMAPYGKMNVLLSDASTALVEGETLQAWAVKTRQFNSEMYASIIALKTAALFQAATEIGAALADAPKAHRDALRTYGYNVGLAFQIVDDILDIVADEKTLGKTSGIDIVQGRGFASVTDDDDRDDGSDEDTRLSDVTESIKQKMLAGDRLEQARQQAHMLVSHAIDAIHVLPDSYAREQLIEQAHYIIEREF